MRTDMSIKECKKRLLEMRKTEKELSCAYDKALESGDSSDSEAQKKALDDLSIQIFAFIEDEYAKAVYEEYNKRKPDLIRIHTGEVVKWNDAFGDDFDEISRSLRHSLVGLVEEPGRYRFK